MGKSIKGGCVYVYKICMLHHYIRKKHKSPPITFSASCKGKTDHLFKNQALQVIHITRIFQKWPLLPVGMNVHFLHKYCLVLILWEAMEDPASDMAI